MTSYFQKMCHALIQEHEGEKETTISEVLLKEFFFRHVSNNRIEFPHVLSVGFHTGVFRRGVGNIVIVSLAEASKHV